MIGQPVPLPFPHTPILSDINTPRNIIKSRIAKCVFWNPVAGWLAEGASIRTGNFRDNKQPAYM